MSSKWATLKCSLRRVCVLSGIVFYSLVRSNSGTPLQLLASASGLVIKSRAWTPDSVENVWMCLFVRLLVCWLRVVMGESLGCNHIRSTRTRHNTRGQHVPAKLLHAHKYICLHTHTHTQTHKYRHTQTCTQTHTCILYTLTNCSRPQHTQTF